MPVGLLANRQVSISSFVEAGDRVLAHVHPADDNRDDGDGDGDVPVERFVVAEVHDGQITQLCGYAIDPEALDALHAKPLAESDR